MIFITFIFLLIGIFSNINDYIPEDAIEYARKYCQNYNPAYKNYGTKNDFETINFVSQSLFAGGQSFSGCRGKDNYSMIFVYNDMYECLRKKGWNITMTKNDKVKKGYPAFIKESRMLLLITDFKDDKAIYCAHKINKKDYCDAEIDEKDLVYFYLDNDN